MLVEIIKEEDVAHQRILVMKERVTVMDLVMEVVMVVIKAARENFYVEVTTARNLVPTIMKKMTVVKNPQNMKQLKNAPMLQVSYFSLQDFVS